MYKSQALRPSTSPLLVRESHIYCCNAFYKCHLCTSHLYPLLPHLRGWAGIMVFTFQSPGISPALWGQADGNNPALCPTLHNRKSQQGKCPNVITPTLPRHCGDNHKVIVRHLPRLFHGYPRRWGPWIQMTGVLSSLNIV